MRNKILLITTAVLLAAPLIPARAAAPPNNLLSDSELTDAGALSLAQIQNFLANKGTLAGYIAADTDGIVRTAAEIIWRVSRDYALSPKFLMALIQREQSLVEDPSPAPKQYDWATGFGVCDSCAKDDPEVVVWKGFAKQVESAARQVRNRYLPDLETKGRTVSGIGPGITKQIDDTPVTPANNATAILYTYTPHLHGNLNFVNIWKRWFGMAYPDGSLVKAAGSTDVWLIQNGERRRLATRSALLTRFKEANVIPIKPEDLDAYSAGPEIKFPNYALVQAPGGTTYLLDGDFKRAIASPEVFRKLGFNPEEVVDATDAELTAYADGNPITLQSSYPQGALLQDKKSGGVYYAADGVKHPIWSLEVLNARFPKKPIAKASIEQLAALPTGEPVSLADGTLVGVKGDKDVYVIEHGTRRPIASEAVFKAFGWKWSNVIWTSPAAVNLHPLGESLALNDDGTLAVEQ